ncbi:MAG: carboxypeptidase regulatory-like domain-containing protein [Acidobacteria bacterium]|nr:carboxypeptidase regulatory-like domain-containing protein [Acidobacteriota bacterium]
MTLRASGSTSGFSATTTSRDDGFFQFSQIAPGSYTMTSTATNFKRTTQEIQVSVDKTTNVSPKLEVGAGEVTVEVTSDSAVSIDLGNTKVDTTITKRIIEDLPAGVTFASLLKIAPNVRPELGGFQIDNQRIGKRVHHRWTGKLLTSVPVHSTGTSAFLSKWFRKYR